MAVHISTFNIAADTRCVSAVPNINYGAVNTTFLVQGDGTSPTSVVLERFAPWASPTSGDPVPPDAVVLASDGGTNFTQIRRHYTATGVVATYSVNRVLRAWVEGLGDAEDNIDLVLDTPDRSGASWNHWIYGASPQAWTTGGASGTGDIDGAKGAYTHPQPPGTGLRSIRDTGMGGDMTMAGLSDLITDSLVAGDAALSIRTSRTASSTACQWRTRENTSGGAAVLTVVWEDAPSGGAGGAHRRIMHGIGIGV